MHIAFVNYEEFQGPSGIHIFHLANALSENNIKSTVIVPNKVGSPNIFGTPRFKVIAFKETKRYFSNQTTPDLIHAWTPRETTRKVTQSLAKRFSIPYIVHIEDNEEAIIDSYLGKAGDKAFFFNTLKYFYSLRPKPICHPERYKQFISNSAGVTLIFENLNSYVPPHLPSTVFWPSCEENIFLIPLETDLKMRERLGISPGDIVLTYPGNVHKANVQDIINLYEAVSMAKNNGIDVKLIRIGQDHAGKNCPGFVESNESILELGDIPPKKIPEYLAVADILVQPGQRNSFNQLRFPSKLPMFLASGRPVIFPKVNFAKYLTDRRKCIFSRGWNSTGNSRSDSKTC